MIIGILGLAGSGKTTVANMIAARQKCAVISVAAPIKAMLLALGLQDTDLHGKGKERVIGWIGKSPRQLMQSLGDWGRSENSTLWASLLAERIDPSKPVVIDDIRLPVEAAIVRSKGGFLLRVVRPGQVSTGHTTERAQQIIEADFELTNMHGLESLRSAVDDLLDDILPRKPIKPLKRKA